MGKEYTYGTPVHGKDSVCSVCVVASCVRTLDPIAGEALADPGVGS